MTTPIFLVTGEETHRIEFEDGSWIDIACSVTAMQRARWTKAATVYRSKIIGVGRKARTETEMDIDQEQWLTAFLTDVVMGSSVGPIDVSQLSERAVTRIREEFERLNPTPGEEEPEELKNSDTALLPTSGRGADQSPAN